MKTNQRLLIEHHQYSDMDRFRLWIIGIWEAIRTAPPKSYATRRVVGPDHPRYDEAGMEVGYYVGTIDRK